MTRNPYIRLIEPTVVQVTQCSDRYHLFRPPSVFFTQEEETRILTGTLS